MRIQSILGQARATLADPAKSRWSDERLLQLLSQGQHEIAVKAQLIKKQVKLEVYKGQQTYALPEDVVFIERAYYNGEPLKMIDYKYVDNIGPKESAKVQYMIFNKHPKTALSIYPTPIENSESPIIIDKPVLGVVTDASEQGVKIYDKSGIITDISAPNLEVEAESPYGAIQDIKLVLYPLEVYYVAEPKALETLDDELEIAPVCDKALRYFIVTHALLDDMDTQNQNAAVRYGQLYNEALKEIMQQSAQDFTNQLEQMETNYYNGVFEWPRR